MLILRSWGRLHMKPFYITFVGYSCSVVDIPTSCDNNTRPGVRKNSFLRNPGPKIYFCASHSIFFWQRKLIPNLNICTFLCLWASQLKHAILCPERYQKMLRKIPGLLLVWKYLSCEILNPSFILCLPSTLKFWKKRDQGILQLRKISQFDRTRVVKMNQLSVKSFT